MPHRNRAELLAPAGDRERLMMALTYGADAVYLAGRFFGMRAAAGNFDDAALAEAVRLCHDRDVRVYAACNTIPTNTEMEALPAYLETLQALGADAVIVSDLGVLMQAKQYAPELPVHISTQAGVMNSATARAFYDLGASRIILARELTLAEIREIREKTPKELELEAFVHGSMCVSFSGRCLLSNYMAGRDANRGDCAQPCRWKYHLVEEHRPGQYMEISEDGGTFLLNSKDLCMIGHLSELIDAGVTSLKIEGRMKSAYYAAVVTNAYRHVLDAVLDGMPPDPIWLQEVDKVSHRAYSTGFFYNGGGPGQSYETTMYQADCDVVAVVERCDANGNAVLTQRNKFYQGDRLELLTPHHKPVAFLAEELLDSEGGALEATPHPMMEFRLKLPIQAPQYSILRKNKA